MRLLMLIIVLIGLTSPAYSAEMNPPASLSVPEYSTTGRYTVSWSPATGSPACESYELQESDDPTFETGVTTVTLSKLWVTSVVIKGKTDGIWYYRVRSVCFPNKYWAANIKVNNET